MTKNAVALFAMDSLLYWRSASIAAFNRFSERVICGRGLSLNRAGVDAAIDQPGDEDCAAAAVEDFNPSVVGRMERFEGTRPGLFE